MNYLENIIYFLEQPIVIGGIALVVAFLLSVRMYPIIIYMGIKKKLTDVPGHRSTHAFKVPTLGGVGLYVSFVLSMILFGVLVPMGPKGTNQLLALLGGVTVLFFMGVKDDMIGLSPTKKMLSQALAALGVILLTGVRVRGFEGLFGIETLPYLVSVLFSVFVFVLVINAYNLIDGIDGLAGSVAICASTSFGLFFVWYGHYLFFLVSFVLTGAMIGFLRYNLSSKRKLFMGDSGSLFVGYLLAYQAIGFLELHRDLAATPVAVVSNAPILILAILMFPILDTVRIFIVRIQNGGSPFFPDRNHIHHRVLRLGLTHKRATLVIICCQVLVIGLALCIGELNIHLQLVIILLVAPLLFLLPFVVQKKEGKLILALPMGEKEKC